MCEVTARWAGLLRGLSSGEQSHRAPEGCEGCGRVDGGQKAAWRTKSTLSKQQSEELAWPLWPVVACLACVACLSFFLRPID